MRSGCSAQPGGPSLLLQLPLLFPNLPSDFDGAGRGPRPSGAPRPRAGIPARAPRATMARGTYYVVPGVTVPSRPKHPAQRLALDVGSPRADQVTGTCVNSSSQHSLLTLWRRPLASSLSSSISIAIEASSVPGSAISSSSSRCVPQLELVPTARDQRLRARRRPPGIGARAVRVRVAFGGRGGRLVRLYR